MMQEMKISVIKVLKSNLCDFNYAYILVKCNIMIAGRILHLNKHLKIVLNLLSVVQKLMEKQ